MMNISKFTSILSQTLPLHFSVFFSSLQIPKQKLTLKREHLHDAFECIENVNEAEILFNYMLQLKPKPYSFHYQKLLRIIVNMEQYPLAIILFKKMTLLGCPVNDYFMNTVIHCYSEINGVDLGFPIMGSFIKRGFLPDVVTFNSLIRGLFLQQNAEKAVALFKKLIKNKFEIDEFTLSIVLDGLCKSGNIDAAVQLLKIAENNDWKLDVVAYTSMVDGFCKCGMLEDAKKVIPRMIDRYILPNIVTYTTLLHALCKHNELDVARRIFWDPPLSIVPNLVTYNVMIQGHCKVKQFQVAKHILEDMEKQGFVANRMTCNIILVGCIRHRDDFDSVDLLKQIVGRDFQLSGLAFFVLLREISEIRRMPGMYDDDIVKQLVLKLVSSDDSHKYDYEELINSLIRTVS